MTELRWCKLSSIMAYRTILIGGHMGVNPSIFTHGQAAIVATTTTFRNTYVRESGRQEIVRTGMAHRAVLLRGNVIGVFAYRRSRTMTGCTIISNTSMIKLSVGKITRYVAGTTIFRHRNVIAWHTHRRAVVMTGSTGLLIKINGGVIEGILDGKTARVMAHATIIIYIRVIRCFTCCSGTVVAKAAGIGYVAVVKGYGGKIGGDMTITAVIVGKGWVSCFPVATMPI